jgi:hypothetical protein
MNGKLKKTEERIEVFEHKGKRFIYYDMSHFRNNIEFKAFIDFAKRSVQGFPQDASLFSITNIEGVVYDSETKNIVAEWMDFNKPFIKQGAVIGLDGIKKIMVNAILKMSGRSNMAFFHTKQEAVEWLSAQ